MTCIPLHKLGRWTYFGWWDPQFQQRWLEYQYTILCRWTWLCQWTPQGNRAEMPSHCYWHLVVKNGNFTLLLTSSGQEWQFHIATDILWSRMAISHCYWHLCGPEAISHCYWHLKNGNFTLLLTSSGQEWQFHITTDILWSRMTLSHCYWHLVV